MSTSILLTCRKASIVILLLMLKPAFAGALTLSGNTQLSGFISQAGIHTDDNNYFGDTDDDISWDYREIGALLTSAPTENLFFSAQLLSRKAGENSDGGVKVDHAMVNYNFINNYDTTLGLRAGRLKSPMGWYNETRDVPFTRPSIFLAQSIYVDRVRNTFYFQDGIHLRGEHHFDLDTVSWHLGYFKPNVDDDELVDVSPLAGIDDSKGEDSWSAGVIYDYDAGKFRLGLSLEERNILNKFEPGMVLDSMDLNNRRAVFSFEYNTEKWSFVGEKAFTIVDIKMQPFSEFNQTIYSQGHYLQGSYRIAEKWDLILRYDVFYFDKDNKDGEGLANDPNFNFLGNPAYAYYAKDWTAGVGWHISPSWLMRLEWHNVEGTAWITAADNPLPNDLEKYWNLYAVQVSYRF